jgi:hypothetical protein
VLLLDQQAERCVQNGLSSYDLSTLIATRTLHPHTAVHRLSLLHNIGRIDKTSWMEWRGVILGWGDASFGLEGSHQVVCQVSMAAAVRSDMERSNTERDR